MRTRVTHPEASSNLATVDAVLRKHVTSRARFDLLLFWSRNPGGWCSRAAVSPFTLLPRIQILNALDQLVIEGVIRRANEGGVAYYALTTNPAARDAVLGLAALPNHERRRLLDIWVSGPHAKIGRLPVGRSVGRSDQGSQR